jgi:light-regulated signal transduction histidine kinase (bacteriophytochrome)
MDSSHLEKVFEVFQRLHTRDKYEGTGIGLALVRTIVERHGGKVRVDSVLGEGSTFTFTLRACAGRPLGIDPSSSDQRLSSGDRVA